MSSDTTIFDSGQKWACLFPGIGVRLFGKEPHFFEKYATFLKPYFDRGSEFIGEDLTIPLLKSQNHHENQLSGELFTYAFSCGTYKVLQAKGFQPSIIAGHSLGLYGALFTAGCISYVDGLEIILRAHQLGKGNCTNQKFGAIVIIGLSHEEIGEELARSGYESIKLANLNNRTSGVYVGLRYETDNLIRWAELAGAVKTIELKTDIPYHNPLFMQKTSKDFRVFLQKFTWKDPEHPVLSALDHTTVKEAHQALELTAANLSTPIHWPGVLTQLSTIHIDAAIECGLGVSLTQHSRFIDGAPRHYNLRNMRRKIDY